MTPVLQEIKRRYNVVASSPPAACYIVKTIENGVFRKQKFEVCHYAMKEHVK